jgi:hypothetical protein
MLTLKSNVCALALSVGTLACAAPSALLPLNPGTYVVSSYKPCEEAPLAGTKEFDGKTFVGPNESQCTSSVVSHHGNAYRVSTRCSAHGDGTPETPTRWTQTVHVESASGFDAVLDGKSVRYELCPAFH